MLTLDAVGCTPNGLYVPRVNGIDAGVDNTVYFSLKSKGFERG
jgi:hypothetical protein